MDFLQQVSLDYPCLSFGGGWGGSASTGHHSLFGIKELLSMLAEEVIQSATSAAGEGSNEPVIFAGGCRTVCIYLFS